MLLTLTSYEYEPCHVIRCLASFLYLQCDVQVQFCTESNSHSDEEAMQLLKASENVVAVESPAYYRAYQPVLQVLKELDLQQIHFK